MKKSVGFLIAAFLLLCSSLFAQDGRFDVSLNVAGKLPSQTTGNGIFQRPTSSVGFLGTVQYSIAPKFSLEANWERTSDSQKYTTGGLFYQVSSDVTEFTGSLVVRPFRRGHWEPFLLGGAGILAFGPSSTDVDGITTSIGAVRQIQPAILYGVGTDYRVTPNFAFRLQYRGLFYQPPDFKVPYLFSGGRGHMAEPAIGVAFNF
jgi:opacity protein-like surface antigen